MTTPPDKRPDPGPLGGPVQFLVVEFPAGHRTGENLHLLVNLVDRGLIHVLDLVFLRRDTDGSVAAVEIADVDGDGKLDLAVFDGAASGIVGADDLDNAGAVLEPGSSAAIIVYENPWAAPLTAALHRSGGRLVAGGLVPDDALITAIEAAETADA
jgi:Family of unknown function (DUF6325)